MIITGIGSALNLLSPHRLHWLVSGVETLTGGLLTLARHIGSLHGGNTAGVGGVRVDQETHDDLLRGNTVLGTEGGLQALQSITLTVRTVAGAQDTTAVTVAQAQPVSLSVSSHPLTRLACRVIMIEIFRTFLLFKNNVSKLFLSFSHLYIHSPETI